MNYSTRFIERKLRLKEIKTLNQDHEKGDFPGGPLVKTSPSSAGGVDSIPGGRTKVHMPVAKKAKHKTKNIGTNSIKTSTMVPIKKNFKKI